MKNELKKPAAIKNGSIKFLRLKYLLNLPDGIGLNLISADVVEVSPAYDHAEVTSLAAATIVYELTNLFAKNPT